MIPKDDPRTSQDVGWKVIILNGRKFDETIQQFEGIL